jgi:protein-tyrosine kinase
MNERSDHLIERAAALLRSAGAGQVVDDHAAAPAQPPPQPRTMAGASPLPSPTPAEDGRGRLPNAPPKFVPPPRPAPPKQLGLSPPPGASRAAPALTRGGSVADVRALLAHPPIALPTLERAGLMVARNSRTRTSEEYRIVIGRVLRALHEEPDGDQGTEGEAWPNVVMITSARPGEGKSFTALNLGGSIAQNAGESVLIVDVDAKNRSMTDELGLSDQRGFLDMVANPDLSPDELVFPTELPNLFFLPLGTRSIERGDEEDDLAAPEGRRLTPPITRVSQRFPKSLILLDAPPCLSTSDPHTLAPAVGQVVMVVEAERTQRNEVEAAIDLIRVCPMVTMLLNKVRMSTGHTFGSYDYFGSYT